MKSFWRVLRRLYWWFDVEYDRSVPVQVLNTFCVQPVWLSFDDPSQRNVSADRIIAPIPQPQKIYTVCLKLIWLYQDKPITVYVRISEHPPPVSNCTPQTYTHVSENLPNFLHQTQTIRKRPKLDNSFAVMRLMGIFSGFWASNTLSFLHPHRPPKKKCYTHQRKLRNKKHTACWWGERGIWGVKNHLD